MKKLSIAIPTYNRCSELKKTLENFIMQIVYNELINDVEIVISDNCSNDDTEDYVRSVLFKYPNLINYSRNLKNISWDNIKKVADISNGEYIWFCGDDDIYFHDSVKRLMQILYNNNVDCIYLNQVNTRGYITPVEFDEVVDMNRFFSIVRQDPEFISTVVIKKSKINKNIKNNTWYHMACLLYLNPYDKFYITQLPFVYNKPSKRNWVNHKNLVYYTVDALECIAYSNADENTKKLLNNIYKILLKKRIVIAKLASVKDIDFKELSVKLKYLLHNDQLSKELILACKSWLYCKYFARKHKYRKIKVPLNKEIDFIESI